MKRSVIIAGFLLLTVVFVAGVTFGANRLSPSTAATQGPAPERVMVISVEEVKNGERFGGEVRITFNDPAEVPDRREDAAGLYLGRDGDQLTLGTGSIEVEKSVEVINDQEPVTTVKASHSGDEILLVVGRDTVYLKDVTGRPEITSEIIEDGELQMARLLESGSLGELDQNMMVRVWGQEKDGRLVAELIVYDPVE